MWIPVAVTEPGAEVSVETLCPPERHGGLLHDVTINPRRIGRPYDYVYGTCVVRGRMRARTRPDGHLLCP